ncbi:MAG: Tad domain-containing protein [Gemmataceae bacterium]|nr:Tad domain-containing protein [Gemmataceae bacterium]
MRLNRTTARRGAILPMVALCLIGLIGLVALAIDIGIVAVARTQAQNAADSAAMAGARTLTGDETGGYNAGAVPGNAVRAANNNTVMGKAVQGNPDENWNPTDKDGNPDDAAKALVHPADHIYKTGQVTVELGAYVYAYNDSDPTQEKFTIQVPRADATEPLTAVRVTINGTGNFAFGRIFGMNTFNVIARAVGAHRPRDVVIVMDLSGSMRFQSLPGGTYTGARTYSLNGESVFPRFGHYSATSSAALQGTVSKPTGGGEYLDPSNISQDTDSGSAICNDFFKTNAGVKPVIPGDRAFSRSSDAFESTPGGDDFLRTSGDTAGNPYASTVEGVVGGTTKNANFETNGYQQYRSDFKGYTEGPGFWGKTFVVWPPDPRGPASSTSDPAVAANHADNGAKDWRQRFFFKRNTSTGALGWLDHNNIMWQTSSSTNPFIKAPHSATTTVTEIVNAVPTSVTYCYHINYAAVLKWLQESPAHFPSQIRAGRIKYYDALPDHTDTTLNNRWWTTQTLNNLNERFWREYIDFVLGVEVNGQSTSGYNNGYVTYTAGTSGSPLTSKIGNGDFFTWGTFKVSQKPRPDLAADYITSGQVDSLTGYLAGMTVLKIKNHTAAPVPGDWVRINTGGDHFYELASYDSTLQTITLKTGLIKTVNNGDTVTFRQPTYMHYQDNPRRARHQYWFGPMTWVDWLGNYNSGQFWWPGNVHEAQAWGCKVGIQSAIDDIKKNHPSDFVGLCFFSSPKYSNSGSGQHNTAVVPLGRNYQQLKDSLWFPPSTIVGGATEITPYDTDMANVPRAGGSTAPGMGFMLAYNLMSNSSKLRDYAQPQPQYRGAAGGLGRRGAERLIIFETDGAPNTAATATLAGSGTDRYYPIRVKNPVNLSDSQNSEWPTKPSFDVDDIYAVVDQICLDVSQGGHSTKRKQVKIYSIAFGSLYDPANAGTTQQNALGFLQTVQQKGNTATTTVWSDFPTDQQIYGTTAERVSRMQAAFSKIMQSGIQVSLLE